MNRGLVIALCVCLFICALVVFFYTPHQNTSRVFTKNDCVEDGVCSEGMKIIINGKEIIISQESCLSQNGKWKEDISVCYLP